MGFIDIHLLSDLDAIGSDGLPSIFDGLSWLFFLLKDEYLRSVGSIDSKLKDLIDVGPNRCDLSRLTFSRQANNLLIINSQQILLDVNGIR